MLVQVILFILENVARFFMMLLVLRFLMQLVRIPFQQPLGQFVVKMSNWLVLPLRRVIPGWGGYDIATLVGALLTGMLLHVLVYVLKSNQVQLLEPGVWFTLLLFGLLELITSTIYCLFGALIVQAVLSWTNPYHPIAASVRRLCDPMLGPLRRFIPPVANVDLTPLVMILILQLLLHVPIATMAASLALSLGHLP